VIQKVALFHTLIRLFNDWFLKRDHINIFLQFSLFIYCFMFCSRIFHLYGDVTMITGEGLQNLGLYSALRAFEHGRDIYRATSDFSFSSFIKKTAQFSRLLRQTKRCGEPILTQILTGLQFRIHFIHILKSTSTAQWLK
jgi:hypothetical protein